MIILAITLPSLVLSVTLCFPVFAQSNSLDSVLKKAQESLDNRSSINTTSATPEQVTPIPQQPSPSSRKAPINADVYIQTKLSYDTINELWFFPKDASINFTKPNKICPDKVCTQELEETSFNTSPPASPDEFYIYGTLKIKDRKASTDNIVAWKFYKIIGWSIKKTDIKEDIKNKQTTSMFDGIMEIGTLDALNNPDISYKIIGSFQELSGLLKFTGTETTDDEFFRGRSVE